MKKVNLGKLMQVFIPKIIVILLTRMCISVIKAAVFLFWVLNALVGSRATVAVENFMPMGGKVEGDIGFESSESNLVQNFQEADDDLYCRHTRS